MHTIDPVGSTDWRLITVVNELLFNLITGLSRERLSSPNSWRQPVNRRSILVWDMIEVASDITGKGSIVQSYRAKQCD